MYLIQHTAFLALLLHQCFVNGFNIFDMGYRLNYLNREINSKTSSDVSDSRTQWILQELDHFNSSDKRVFKMKYIEGLKYSRANGPIYLFLEYTRVQSNNFWITSGIMEELAKETHGAMYIAEHRYYGDSMPFSNLNAENMKYSSSKQTLADIAKLIIYLKSLPMYKDSKVVVIGGFYAGNLAAWMKVLYPKLIDAAISSSAPVLAQKDSFEMLKKIKNNYKRYGGTECLQKITKKIKNYDLLLQSPEGIKQLKKDKHICDSSDMTVLENQQYFFFWITSYLVMMSFQVRLIEKYCASDNDKHIYSSFLNEYLKAINSDKKCINLDFEDFIRDIEDFRKNGQFFYTALYKHCTEFGHFPTTSSKDQPFLNIPLEFYIKICSKVYGNNFNEKRIDEGVEISNKLYGGLKPNVTNVVFTNGELDASSSISILKDLSHDAQALVIPRECYCSDLFSDMDGDSEALKAARKYVKHLIKKWISVGEYLN